jgi:hypothetical protein
MGSGRRGVGGRIERGQEGRKRGGKEKIWEGKLPSPTLNPGYAHGGEGKQLRWR